jgi:hypothetical protein
MHRAPTRTPLCWINVSNSTPSVVTPDIIHACQLHLGMIAPVRLRTAQHYDTRGFGIKTWFDKRPALSVVEMLKRFTDHGPCDIMLMKKYASCFFGDDLVPRHDSRRMVAREPVGDPSAAARVNAA